ETAHLTSDGSFSFPAPLAAGEAQRTDRAGITERIAFAPPQQTPSQPLAPSPQPLAPRDFSLARDFSTTENTETSIWSYRLKRGFQHGDNYPLLPLFNPNFSPEAHLEQQGASTWHDTRQGDMHVQVAKNNTTENLTKGDPAYYVHKSGQ